MSIDTREFTRTIRELVNQQLAGMSRDCVFEVESVNADGTLNGYVLPDKSNILNNIINESRYNFSHGDTAVLYLMGGRLSNAFVIAKFNPKPGDSEAE